eukprot:SAG22_NODE_1345_length_4675_cov_2.245629_4_plen_41_part_00
MKVHLSTGVFNAGNWLVLKGSVGWTAAEVFTPLRYNTCTD